MCRSKSTRIQPTRDDEYWSKLYEPFGVRFQNDSDFCNSNLRLARGWPSTDDDSAASEEGIQTYHSVVRKGVYGHYHALSMYTNQNDSGAYSGFFRRSIAFLKDRHPLHPAYLLNSFEGIRIQSDRTLSFPHHILDTFENSYIGTKAKTFHIASK